ncbi:MAG: response regulator [Shimia sp.]|uniref:response regulator n=1 Tax=Shimia sp. TaxID=1954381 RepID=UPI004057FBD4
MSLAEKIANERRARLAAEQLLAIKQAELSTLQTRFGAKTQKLTTEIREVRSDHTVLLREKNQMQSEIAAAANRADQAEQRLWSSIGAVRDGFAFFDETGEMLAANPAYLASFNHSDVVKPGASITEIVDYAFDGGIIDFQGQDPETVRAALLQGLKDDTIEPFTLKLWNGRFVQPILKTGENGDRVSLIMDVTDAVAFETTLQTALEAAEAAKHAKSAFLANMSHEIRTPMNGLVGMADLLMESELTEEQHLFASTIKSSGEALMSVINDVLDYSKIGAGNMALREDSFDLERCIHEVIAMLQIPARERGLELLVDYDLFLPTEFVGDPARVRQVLTKLIENAIKFTREGHVLVRVVGVIVKDGAETVLHVTVQDTGIGIAGDRLEHIFGEFTQADEAQNREFEGAGLGLAITRQLIHRMGGEIWVDSIQGEGTSFGFRLALPVHENCEKIPTPLPQNVEHIVVASDISINCDLLKKQLEQLGARVTICGDKKRALTFAPQADLVVIDHGPGHLDALDLASELQRQASGAPVILMTSDENIRAKAADIPIVAAVVRKPISRNALCRCIETSAGSSLPAKLAPSGAHKRRMRVLSAEDNKTNRLVLTKLLRPLDLDLEFAHNGEEAVEMYKAKTPDLILMDISMPKMDGKEATRHIRDLEKESGKRTPIVALTALAGSNDADEIRAAGLDVYLTKPVRKAEVFNVISQSLPDDVSNPFNGDGTPDLTSQLSG